jgi:hypothetical protein
MREGRCCLFTWSGMAQPPHCAFVAHYVLTCRATSTGQWVTLLTGALGGRDSLSACPVSSAALVMLTQSLAAQASNANLSHKVKGGSFIPKLSVRAVV